MELRPISEDAVEGPGVVAPLVAVYAWTGQIDIAFEKLSMLIKLPSAFFTYGELKTDPTWDPLRKDPRFDKLLAELAPKDSGRTPPASAFLGKASLSRFGPT